MKKEFLPYYISRATLSFIFAFLILGLTWKALFFTFMLFGLFLLYLHSGWFTVDLRNPLLPLRRDPRGQEIQRKALITSLIVGLLVYLLSPVLPGISSLSISGNLALSVGVIAYFITQFILFVRT